ncbi:hypothetical protein O9K51_06858 [Purpureocillium lavendulum]|uniref:N-acetylglucosaminylphosphatidylinositol deacetylase n=1 Tax=Purpureocillium lavendulum TaxID=1247861 RepID=A0AB34FQL4_9HYPO|nr:hypothetical protein O9K51_06858 [Purpureocillium lavendulum]
MKLLTEMDSIPCKIFLSPHPDDVAYSCFGSIAHPPPPRADGTLIVTVFSVSKTAAALPEEQKNPDTVTSLRKSEDEAFAKAQGCQIAMLGFPDSAMRDEPNGGGPAAISEATKHPLFNEVKSAIAKTIAPAIGRASIYIPLGILGHVDHRMVRDAVQQIAAESNVPGALPGLIYYEDLPYAAFATATDIRKLARAVISQSAVPYDVSLKGLAGRKRIAVQGYSSQATPYILQTLDEYASSISADRLPHTERLWIADTSYQKPVVDVMAWVTWEAARRVGGFTTLFKHIFASPKFRQVVGRTILLGPMYMPTVCPEYDPLEDIHSIATNLDCHILYPQRVSTATGLHARHEALLRDIERRYDVTIFYLRDKGQPHAVDRVLFNFSTVVDQANVYMKTLPSFLQELKQRMNVAANLKVQNHPPIVEALGALKEWTGFDPHDNTKANAWKKARCDSDPSFYAHKDSDATHGFLLGEPVADCLRGLLDPDEEAVLIATEELSLPTAYAVQMARERHSRDNGPSIKTLFYSGDVHPVRNLTTGAVTPDSTTLDTLSGFGFEGPIRTLIRLSLRAASLDDQMMPMLRRYFLDFHPLRKVATHTNMRIVQQGWRLDALAATSLSVRDEMVFLGRNFASKGEIPIISPGVGIIPCDETAKDRCRKRLLSYATHIWGFNGLDPEKTIIAAQIARAVAPKGFVRAVNLLKTLSDSLPADSDVNFIFIIVTSWDERKENIGDYRIINDLIAALNGTTTVSTRRLHIKVINQPRWPLEPEGHDMNTGLTREDFHRATDLSLCLSLYDTFAIAPLEPVSCGAVAVVSTGCGCYRKIQELHDWEKNVMIVDYAEDWAQDLVHKVDGDPNAAMDDLFNITREDKIRLEADTHRKVAQRLLKMLPWDASLRREKMAKGRRVAEQLNWEDQFSAPFERLLRQMFEPERA